MWWLIVPVVGLVGKVIYEAVTDGEAATSPFKKSTLELNFERLRDELNSHERRKIAILGQPGAGKSSFLKKLTNGKVVPLPVIGTETDATDWSADSKCNLISHHGDNIYIDVPGYDTQSHPLNKFESAFPFKSFDVFVFVFHGKLHDADERIFRLAKQTGKHILIARSFMESLDENERTDSAIDIRMRLSVSPESPVLFFSNRTNMGIKELKKALN